MDRQLLELRRAFAQRLLNAERNIRFLKRRVRYPGAMQAYAVEDVKGMAMPSYQTVGEIVVDPGRWLVITEAVLQMTTGYNGTEGIRVTQLVKDVASGDTLHFDFMTAKGTYTVSGTGTALFWPVTFVHAYTFTGRARIGMRVTLMRDGTAGTGDVVEMTFQALPF